MFIINNLDFFSIICKIEILFIDLTYDFKISRTYNLQPQCYLRKNLLSRNEYFTIEAHKFSNMSEMSFTFITNHNKITQKYYLK